MKLDTIYQLGEIRLTVTKTQRPHIADKIRLTNMGKQNARNKAERMTETFARTLVQYNKVAAIDKKIAKKKSFFDKHKSNL